MKEIRREQRKNLVKQDGGVAMGMSNVVGVGSSLDEYTPSESSLFDTGTPANSFAFGESNYVSGTQAFAFGKKNIVSIPLTSSNSIPHPTSGRFGAAKLVLRPSAPGSGVIAGSSIRTVLELAGGAPADE